MFKISEKTTLSKMGDSFILRPNNAKSPFAYVLISRNGQGDLVCDPVEKSFGHRMPQVVCKDWWEVVRVFTDNIPTNLFVKYFYHMAVPAIKEFEKALEENSPKFQKMLQQSVKEQLRVGHGTSKVLTDITF